MSLYFRFDNSGLGTAFIGWDSRPGNNRCVLCVIVVSFVDLQDRHEVHIAEQERHDVIEHKFSRHGFVMGKDVNDFRSPQPGHYRSKSNKCVILEAGIIKTTACEVYTCHPACVVSFSL